jgi:predicted Zn-dependent peptidase
MPFHSHKLANGLQIIGESNPAVHSAALGFFVRTGARDETPELAGVSHFLEHMAFKGTPRRTALDVNRDLDRIGADSNAYTSEENTVYHTCVLPEYLPQAIDVMADILRPSLRQDDFDMEKKVILEEIGMYEDQPGFCAYEHAKRLHFGSHRLGNSVLGTVESVGALSREQMLAYFQRRYGAPNVTVSVAGKIDWPSFVREIDRACGGWSGEPVVRECLREASASQGFEVKVKDKVMQEHAVLIGQGPPADSPLRYAADLLAMVIGDDSGSRLYWTLVDPGLADSADSSFHEYEQTGAFYTSYTCEPERTEENLALVLGVLQAVQTEGIREEELTQARNKMLSRIVRASERPKGRMMALGMNWTYQHEYRSVDDELKLYQKVSRQSIGELLERYPLPGVTTLVLGPLDQVRRPN